MAKIKVISGDEEFEFQAESGQVIADLLLAKGIFIDRPCAGRGVCGKCRVLAEGKLSPANEKETKLISSRDLSAGYRLACQTVVLGDVRITLPQKAILTDKIFSAEYPVEELKGPFGLAIDLGTTTVGAFLVTLEDGAIHRGYAVLNQQSSFGAEVISRIASALEGNAQKLKLLARSSIEEAVLGLGLKNTQLKQVERAVVVGNSVMHHLLLGLSVEGLARLPFQPTDTSPQKIKTNFFKKEIEVWLPPLLGGFVGSDALSCLVYLGFGLRSEPQVAVDLGTNGEVMVSNGKEILVTSTSAGPAFEGVNIECGTRAVKGAIYAVRKGKGGEIEPEVIGEKAPKGITGSGLLSLASLLLKEGKLSRDGRLKSEDGKFWLSENVYLSQKDIRELQKAKSAIRTSIDLLMEKLGLSPAQIQRFTITGSFGAKINIDDLFALKMIPEIPKERIYSFANSAGIGAGMLLHSEAFEFACQLAEKVKHIELATDPEFMDRFIENMKF